MTKHEYSNIKELRKEYEKFQKKYNLPDFSELNKLFDVEDIEIETEFLLRRIRRIISDRITGYLKFVEIILNPVNSPLFFLKLINKLDNKDKHIVNEINNVLGKTEIDILYLDLDYNEEKEAEFIKKIYNLFNNDVRLKLLKIVEKFNNGDEPKKKDNGDRSYFG